MLLLVLACLSCVLLAWLRCAFGAAFSSTAAYFAIKPMHAPHRPTILLNCHSDNFVRLALQDGPTAEITRQSLGKTTGFGTARPPAPPPSGKTASLVPQIAGCEFSDLGFLRAPGTKSPKLAEIGEPNPRFLSKTARNSFAGNQTTCFCHASFSSCAVFDCLQKYQSENVEKVKTG